MFSPSLMQRGPSPLTLTEGGGGGRLQSFMNGFEARVHLFAMYTYELVCDVSPLPFEVTVLLAVFTFITVRQLVLWYTLDLKRETNGYVYWHMKDLISTELLDSFKREHHLNSAMIVYITQKLWRNMPLTAAELKNKAFTIHLLLLHSKAVDDELEEYYSDMELNFCDHVELLLPVKLPIYPYWTPVHEGGVEVCTWITTTRIKNQSPEAHRYLYLRARKDDSSQGGANADAALRRFVDNAVAFYFANGYADRDDHSLRMYRISPSVGRILVKAAPMPLAPTLDTVFFPQSEAVRVQLQHFTEKKGRYAINGFPRKLGFLLYGPRGTGKRSFVRALAYHTKRHLVRIPLSRFTKNEQLYNTFHFEAAVTGSAEDWSMLNSRKVIFLLEDVDTESEVVRARGSSHTARVRRSRGLTTRGTRELKDSFEVAKCLDDGSKKPSDNTSSSNYEDDAEEDDEAHTPRAHGSTQPVPAHNAATAVAPPAPLMAVPELLGLGGALFAREDAKLDAINLSSLLNILDGVVEDPERIVVMIADHPERLDPALLRSGRLATHVRFDYIELNELIGLCGLFYGSECLFVKGTLRGDAAAMLARVHSGVAEYTRAVTSGDESPPFPHEMQDNSMKGQSAKKTMANGDDALLKWQRHEYRSAETEKLEEQIIRQLSSMQAAKVRASIAALEEENVPRRNFLVTPAHAHHLCMHAKTLDLFLESLCAYIRGGGRDGLKATQ
ncbi:a44l protein-like protein [Leptomonas pyrrhocoris]|uniref:A44l protein-like protein n=1 Tax=Leptomonas pyrrhocoris TaxID=157538 RepID=A0A0M9G425_LEPPY|nr:a44l protein-like protein [Leptomonas pyrrhocoris]KPA81729.1 a44l protein-like protein [Leptomonas pyrrhocoris]|eukprot:XP_015660168.1 a44l protein-like protein [Leptomonas pyrrhocoris]